MSQRMPGLTFFIILSAALWASSCSDLPFRNLSKTKSQNEPKAQLSAEVFMPSAAQNKTAFRDVSADLGLEGVSATSIYAVDFDGDSYTDLVFLPDFYSIPDFYRYDPQLKRFTQYQKPLFTQEVWASYLLFFDYNRDGLLDMVAGAPKRQTALHQHPLRLFVASKQKGELQYREQPEVFANELYPSYSLAPIDIDLDGNLDFYIANWYHSNRGKMMVTPDRLYHWQKGKYRDVTPLLSGELDYLDELQLYANARPTYAASICDVDQNGHPDIMTSSSNGMSNKLWLNVMISKTDRGFEDHGPASGFASDQDGVLDRMGGGDSYFARCLDYNNDGIVDIVAGELSHSYDASTRDRSAILSGSTFKFPPRFIRTEYFMDNGQSSWNQGDKRVTILDYNLDGLPDLIVDNNGFPPDSRLIFFHQDENHAYRDLGQEYGVNLSNPSGTVTLDFNRDGLPDFISGQVSTRSQQMKRRVFLFQNIGQYPEQRSVGLSLFGVKSNSMGWGAAVKLVGSEHTQWRYHYPFNGGFSSQDEDGMIFGLGQTEQLKRVEVTWPTLNAKGSPLKVSYQLPLSKGKKKLHFTLCESGEILEGKQACQP